MKYRYMTLPAKIVCFILCLLLLSISVSGIAATVIFADADFYSRTEEQLKEQALYDLYRSDVNNIAYDVFGYYGEIEDIDEYTEKYTNLRFKITDWNGKSVAENFIDSNDSFDELCIYESFFVYEKEYYDYIVYSNYDDIENNDEVYTIRAYLDEGLPLNDKYKTANSIIGICYSLRYLTIPIAAVSFLLSVVCFIFLMCASARKPDSDDLCPGHLNKVPIDLLIAGSVLILHLYFLFVFEEIYDDLLSFTLIALGIVASGSTVLGLCMSIAARLKQKTLIKNSVIGICLFAIGKILKRCAKGCKKIVKAVSELFLNISVIWKSVLIVLVITLVEILVFVNAWWETGFLVIFWVIEKLLVVPCVLYVSLILRKLQKGGIALANGDVNYKTDTSLMFWDFKRHGENLNSISEGMSSAVEKRVQSERMKTELITNVSHDIKTPLTSIINYASLIKEQECENVDHNEYAEVLVRKSVHLKRLLDDLVEVSKASSGVLDISLSRCDVGVLLTQVVGEYQERCKAAELELITNKPNEEMFISVDSRRIWRVFENLMNNACKYSLKGSRVYVTVEKIKNNIVFTFKNTSSAALNISTDELMERFVRGDTSRSTEGNGLGLSIARSLTELQNGQFELYVDGDLFKVIVSFPAL